MVRVPVEKDRLIEIITSGGWDASFVETGKLRIDLSEEVSIY